MKPVYYKYLQKPSGFPHGQCNYMKLQLKVNCFLVACIQKRKISSHFHERTDSSSKVFSGHNAVPSVNYAAVNSYTHFK